MKRAEWRKCSEELPPIGEKVLIRGAGNGLYVGALTEGKEYFKAASQYIKGIYWLPIPPITKEKSGAESNQTP